MSCDGYKELLSAYVDGELTADERARTEAHVKACAACRDALAEYLELSSAMRAMPREAAPASVAAAFRQRAACDAEQVSAAVDGRADASKHLSACGDCRSRAEDWREIAKAFRALPRAQAPASILAAVRAEMAKSNVVPFFRRSWFQYGMAAAATVVVTLNVVYVAGGFTPKRKAQPETVARAPAPAPTVNARPETREGGKLGFLDFKEEELRNSADRFKSTGEAAPENGAAQFSQGWEKPQAEKRADDLTDHLAAGVEQAAPPAPATPEPSRAPAADKETPPAAAMPMESPNPDPVVLMYHFAPSTARALEQERGRFAGKATAFDGLLSQCQTYQVESADKTLDGAVVLSATMTEEELEAFKKNCEKELGVALALMTTDAEAYAPGDRDKNEADRQHFDDARKSVESSLKKFAGGDKKRREANKEDAEEAMKDSAEAADELEKSMATHGYRLRSVEGKKAEAMVRRNLEGMYESKDGAAAGLVARHQAGPANDPAAPMGGQDLAKGLAEEKSKTPGLEPPVATGAASSTGGGAGGADAPKAKESAGRTAAKPNAAKPEASKRLVRVVVWLMNPPAPETKPADVPAKTPEK